MEVIQIAVIVLAVVGALNWGLVGRKLLYRTRSLSTIIEL